MEQEKIEKVIELNNQLKELKEIERSILVSNRDKRWYIKAADSNDIDLPHCLRIAFDNNVRRLIKETTEELENL